jgi:hypothetical protein
MTIIDKVKDAVGLGDASPSGRTYYEIEAQLLQQN